MDLNQIEPIARMINEFSKLPSVGRKTAERYAYYIIRSSDEQAKSFADSILNLKAKIKFCEVCGNYTEQSPCKVCRERSSKVICVVKEPNCCSVAVAIFSLFQILKLNGLLLLSYVYIKYITLKKLLFCLRIYEVL